MLLLEAVFWVLVAALLWPYLGYPLLLATVATFRRRSIGLSPIEPSVSVIVSAYNEEKCIAATIRRLVSLDYPADKLEIIVASDSSADRTEEIVREFEPLGIQLVVLPRRAGKTAAQNLAVEHSRGEILVFADATIHVDSTALRHLVKAFSDPRVGCVGAELEYLSEAGTAVGKGGSLYWRYERWVKTLETRANSLIGVSGCLYGVRRKLYSPIEPDLISDFTIALDVYAKGYLTVCGPGAVVREKTHEDPLREFEMRTRVVIRSIHALVRRAHMLNPFRYGFFALQLWSHKVLRYLVPEVLAAAAVVGGVLSLQPDPRAWLYQAMLAVELGVILLIPVLYLLSRLLGHPLNVLYAPVYFVNANLAAGWALISYLRGNRRVTWTTLR